MTQSTDFVETDSRLSIPIAVILERQLVQGKKWAMPQWRVYAVVSGSNLNQDDQQLTIHENDSLKRQYWGGMRLDLYKDGSEGYWYNLLSDEPYLFVICDGDPSDSEVEPRFVTANQDEATAHLESDDMVLSVPMPVEIRSLLERYVISHYQPQQKKKRKRREWLEESEYAKRPKH